MSEFRFPPQALRDYSRLMAAGRTAQAQEVMVRAAGGGWSPEWASTFRYAARRFEELGR